MFFIIIHQSAELWFKEIHHETVLLVKAFRKGNISQALKILKRLIAIADLLEKQIRLLSTLTPVEFAGFRDDLNPASGFQSASFRLFEFAYGIRDAFFIKFFDKLMPEVVKKLEEIRQQPSVYDEFLASFSRAGFKVPCDILERDYRENRQKSHPELLEEIKKVYENPGKDYHWVLLFEALLDFDEHVAMFRQAHIQVVERCIGNKEGTGGSSGIEFLKSRANLRFFPELWQVRTLIGATHRS
jgi:tryptophan 2,3-dioxygenase